MPYEWFIAMRYLFARRKQTFISITSAITLLGVALGVWVMITVLSVMNGFEEQWRDKIIGANAHVIVTRVDGAMDQYDQVLARIDKAPGVTGAAPFQLSQVMLRSESGVIGVELKGIDPERAPDVTNIKVDLREGKLEWLDNPPPIPPAEGEEPGEPTRYPGIIIGEELASLLDVRLQDTLVMVSPFGGRLTPAGPSPKYKRFQVVGLFKSGFYQFDAQVAYLSLDSSQELLSTGKVASGIEVKTTGVFEAEKVARALETELGFPFNARAWTEFNPTFFSALRTEKVTMTIILVFIVAVAAFGIISTLVMMVMEKHKDIAILKTMGATNGGISRIFLIEGLLIGGGGIASGLSLGLYTVANIERLQRGVEKIVGFNPLPPDIYNLSQLPAKIEDAQITLILASALAASVIATVFPSWQASRVDPVEGLRSE
ncbi:MAG: lipoprotein-releasing ABC transporter permease subunit [Deltaproteobacteria bacterium]|nr:lipoprotein-releasing ABC transporter permease subunit [Deltaproteobacteria bacterium]